MTKKIQLDIPTPCHENWDNMKAAEKGRFCDSCQKQVVDFTRMTDREIALFFKKKTTGSVCGRFMDDQLNRDMDIPKKRIPWFKYFFQFALPAFIISNKATAQGNIRIKIKDTVAVPNKCLPTSFDPVNKEISQDIPFKQTKELFSSALQGRLGGVSYAITIQTNEITGRVINDSGEPLPYATISVKGMNKGVVTDSNGVFHLDMKSKKTLTLVASSIGYNLTEVTVEKWNGKQLTIVLQSAPASLTGEVVIVGQISPGRVKKNSTPAIIPVDPESSSMNKIYPNPLPSGSPLHIQWDGKETGNFVLQFFNASGAVVFKKEIFIDKEAKLLNIETPKLVAGNYFVRIKGPKKTYAEKIVIE